MDHYYQQLNRKPEDWMGLEALKADSPEKVELKIYDYPDKKGQQLQGSIAMHLDNEFLKTQIALGEKAVLYKDVSEHVSDLKNAFSLFFFIMKGPNAVGFIKLGMEIKRKRGCIDGLFLYPEERRKGYAKEALTLASAFFKKNGMCEISLGVFTDNTGAVKLYEKLGFKPYTVFMKKKI